LANYCKPPSPAWNWQPNFSAAALSSYYPSPRIILSNPGNLWLNFDNSRTMPRRLITILVVVVIGCLLAGLFLVRANRFRLPVQLTLRLSVSPAAQADYVEGQGSSAKIKYDAAKQAGMKPALGQRLSIKPLPNSALLEVRAGAETRDEARRFGQAFLQLLKERCAGQAEVTLVEEQVR
jgi:hypothetical protein